MTELPPVPLPVLGLLVVPVLALLAGFALKSRRLTHWPILISCALVAACAAWTLAWCSAGRGLDRPLWTWMLTEKFGVSFGLRVDGLGAAVLAMAALVGGLIHVYAAGYMKDEPAQPRFFLSFHLFFLSMIGLLLSNNLIQLYLFWELMGACSYLLIGYYADRPSARRAAFQAFIVNRIGDFGFLLAVLLLSSAFSGNTRFHILPQITAALQPEAAALIASLLVFAATAKSAQFPLYFWLPDAMEGPTPVSALMHAATMVTAGIFLMVRCWPLISSVPGLPEMIAALGALTALFSAVIACTRKDLKRILAYSTVSHLGLMAMAVGLGQPAAAVFHLLTHGFFKAVLFLCAGNVAHALHQGSASVDETGGLRREMKATFLCFAVAALSASGLWPFAGFYSKDAILDAAMHHGAVWSAVGLAISFLSAFYMGRMLFLVFFGPRPEQKRHGQPHEAEPGLAVPVAFLSIGALAAGWLAAPLSALLGNQGGAQLFPAALPEFSMRVALYGTGAALFGWAVSWLLTMALPSWDWRWRARLPALERAFDKELGYKPLMNGLGSGVWSLAGWIGRAFDKKFWDGLIEASAGASHGLAELGGRWASGRIGDSLWWLAAGSFALLLLGGLR
jgi:NADH-quinone oxidoreductase subunit L